MNRRKASIQVPRNFRFSSKTLNSPDKRGLGFKRPFKKHPNEGQNSAPDPAGIIEPF